MTAQTCVQASRAVFGLFGIILLTGCASPLPEPVVTQTIEVQIPVEVPCWVKLPEKPIWELDRTPVTATIFELARAAVIELRQRQAFQAQLEAAAKACSD